MIIFLPDITAGSRRGDPVCVCCSRPVKSRYRAGEIIRVYSRAGDFHTAVHKGCQLLYCGPPPVAVFQIVFIIELCNIVQRMLPGDSAISCYVVSIKRRIAGCQQVAVLYPLKAGDIVPHNAVAKAGVRMCVSAVLRILTVKWLSRLRAGNFDRVVIAFGLACVRDR